MCMVSLAQTTGPRASDGEQPDPLRTETKAGAAGRRAP